MNIVLGITGGIAAYKSCELVRRLRDHGHDVRVMMTASAMEFVTPMTFQALSGHPVNSELFDPEQEYAMGHIGLARWADKILIMPASANVIAKLAQGIADDIVTTTCLATEAPITIVPSMNRLMWANPATQANVELLKSRGFEFLGPVSGSQACGEVGEGRMMEVADVLDAIQPEYRGKLVLTAGPTAEPIDPVRVLSNKSSGKMGFALADAFALAGYDVTLISGPTALPTPPRVKRIDVETTDEMYRAVEATVLDADLFISAAAVCDYKPATVFEQKIKKKDDALSLTLEPNIDILKTISHMHPDLFTVGFALESESLEANAKHKLEKKKLDMIVANRVEASLGRDDAEVTVYTPSSSESFGPLSKQALARALQQHIELDYQSKTKHKKRIQHEAKDPA